ncbi:MAG: hypothetical protein Q8P31_00885 [Bacillota bacterium]|nr:hypothetical protein [Bacillota bacterium]
MRRSRAILAVLVSALLIILPTAALAAERTVQTPALNLSIQNHTDGYKVILDVDPMGMLRAKTGRETYSFTPVDNGKAKVTVDPIFVVGS